MYIQEVFSKLATSAMVSYADMTEEQIASLRTLLEFETRDSVKVASSLLKRLEGY